MLREEVRERKCGREMERLIGREDTELERRT
jgi:hypothetical protein